MKKYSVLFMGLWSLLSCSGQPEINQNQTKVQKVVTTQKDKVDTTLKVGAENISKIVDLLKGKRFGFVGNQTSQISNVHMVDTLLALDLKPEVVFAPEHGFRGKKDAGEHVENGKDAKTNIPIISLYGNHKKPTALDLQGLDVIVFDIQDVGVRFYTYISTLHYVMEACAEQNIKVVVLDRPNPNGGLVDGPMLEKEHTSFVGMHPIPIAHGMTIGEYAQMINGEKWLGNGVECELEVVKCEYYNRLIPYSLPVKPSPNLPNAQSVMLYPSLCLFEGTTVSVGRGTKTPFQIFGSPELNGDFSFTPKSGPGSKYPKHENKLCKGADLREIDALTSLKLEWLMEAYKQSPQSFFKPFFTKLAGTKKLREQIEKGLTEQEIKATWKMNLEQFKKMRQGYLLYP